MTNQQPPKHCLDSALQLHSGHANFVKRADYQWPNVINAEYAVQTRYFKSWGLEHRFFSIPLFAFATVKNI